jgi:hypothetical protein
LFVKSFVLIKLQKKRRRRRKKRKERNYSYLIYTQIQSRGEEEKKRTLTESSFILNSVGDINENYVYCQDLLAIVELLYKMVQ